MNISELRITNLDLTHCYLHDFVYTKYFFGWSDFYNWHLGFLYIRLKFSMCSFEQKVMYIRVFYHSQGLDSQEFRPLCGEVSFKIPSLSFWTRAKTERRAIYLKHLSSISSSFFINLIPFLLSLFMFCITRRRICHGLCLICKRLQEDANKACTIYHHLAASLVTLLK